MHDDCQQILHSTVSGVFLFVCLSGCFWGEEVFWGCWGFFGCCCFGGLFFCFVLVLRLLYAYIHLESNSWKMGLAYDITKSSLLSLFFEG